MTEYTQIPLEIKDIEAFLTECTILINYYNEAQEKMITKNTIDNELYINCLQRSHVLIKFLDAQHKKNPFIVNRYKNEIKMTYYISSDILIRIVGFNIKRTSLAENEKNNLYIAISHLRKVLSIDPLHINAKELFKTTFMYLTLFNPDIKENLTCLNQVLPVSPCDFQLHYNFGFMYHRVNELDKSLYHFKLALGIIDLLLQIPTSNKKPLEEFKIKCLNGIGSIYFSIQDKETALYYYQEAHKIDPLDPDVNNQIGVVYTELRYTDKAIEYYQRGIDNFERSHISQDKDMLIASMHMNMGLAKCYECDFEGAIAGYNQALKYKPRLSLAYQNKLLDLNYISHRLSDPMLISRLHKSINKIYPQVISDYKESCPNYIVKQFNDKSELCKTGKKLVLGFVSGDFICHPVAYFIHSILKYLNYDIFEVHCYSVKIIDLTDMFPNCKWHVIKNKSNIQFKTLIQSHNVDILFDLSAHTGDNRLDTFVLKPAPIQISYCGYPNSSGIRSIDYRITDKFCDSEKSQKYYQEQFIFMNNSFLCYTPSTGIENIPELSPQSNCNWVTFGCFNRYNKINEIVIATWEKILQQAPSARFIIKTKEFLTPKLKHQFLSSFRDKSVLDRIEIMSFSDTYLEHLSDYNKMDISLDTFPYSGTTTSCESLMMGVPVLTLFDNIRHYHSQNVTTSLLKNSNLHEFVTCSNQEYIEKAVYYANNLSKLKNLKQNVRQKFINGHVCNYPEFIDDFENKIINTYKTHKW